MYHKSDNNLIITDTHSNLRAQQLQIHYIHQNTQKRHIKQNVYYHTHYKPDYQEDKQTIKYKQKYIQSTHQT